MQIADPSLDEWSVEDDVMEGRAMWPGMGGAPQRVSFQIYSPFAIYQLKSTYAKFTEGQQVVVYGRLWGPGRTGKPLPLNGQAVLIVSVCSRLHCCCRLIANPVSGI